MTRTSAVYMTIAPNGSGTSIVAFYNAPADGPADRVEQQQDDPAPTAHITVADCASGGASRVLNHAHQ